MCLATDILVQCGEQVPRDASKPQESVILFRQCSAQCLILSDYTKPNNYTVDALLLYCFCEILQFHDTHYGLYLVLSMIVRVAMRMGYHRDPSHYPNISIFAGELRRRVWALLAQLDVLVSLQIGLPRLIHEHDSDTASPRNIPKEDMDPEMTILPPSRPESSGAVLSYMIARMRLMSVLGRIHGHVTSIHPLSYDTVIHFHGQLNTQYKYSLVKHEGSETPFRDRFCGCSNETSVTGPTFPKGPMCTAPPVHEAAESSVVGDVH